MQGASIVTASLAFLAIMNPIANVPIFPGLVGDADERSRREIAIRSVLIAFAVAAGFAALGHLVMRLFGISLPALRIFGGVLVARIGFDLIISNQSQAYSASATGDQPGFGIAVSPLAVPILAGPGTLVAAATPAPLIPVQVVCEILVRQTAASSRYMEGPGRGLPPNRSFISCATSRSSWPRAGRAPRSARSST